MKYYFIKNDYGEYWHKNKRRWIKPREKVPPYESLEKLHQFLDNEDHKIWEQAFYVNNSKWNIVEIEVSEEKVIEENVNNI